jgi:hypothetical protein
MGAPALSMDYVNPVAPGLCRCTAGGGNWEKGGGQGAAVCREFSRAVRREGAVFSADAVGEVLERP